MRTRPCYKPDVTCNCAVAVREGNNILGVYACDLEKPPSAVRYLEDPEVPGARMEISPNGKEYTVNVHLLVKYIVLLRTVDSDKPSV